MLVTRGITISWHIQYTGEQLDDCAHKSNVSIEPSKTVFLNPCEFFHEWPDYNLSIFGYLSPQHSENWSENPMGICIHYSLKSVSGWNPPHWSNRNDSWWNLLRFRTSGALSLRRLWTEVCLEIYAEQLFFSTTDTSKIMVSTQDFNFDFYPSSKSVLNLELNSRFRSFSSDHSKLLLSRRLFFFLNFII